MLVVGQPIFRDVAYKYRKSVKGTVEKLLTVKQMQMLLINTVEMSLRRGQLQVNVSPSVESSQISKIIFENINCK